jgi:nucleotide-binding universal stress UspA family protein
MRDQLISTYFLVVLALALVYYLRSRPELSLPLIYLGVSFLTLLSFGKIGAHSNYFLEWNAVLCCCAGVAYSSLRTLSDSRNFVSTLMPGALALMVVVNLHRPTPDPFKQFTECRQAYEYVKDYPGRRILSENLGAVVIAGKPPVVMDPFSWTQMIVHGGWPDTEIVDLIRSRQIDLVVLGSDVKDRSNQLFRERWPKSVADAIEQNYRLVHTFNCTDANFVYRPETPPK